MAILLGPYWIRCLRLFKAGLPFYFFSYREEIFSCQEPTVEITEKVEQTVNSEWIGSLSWCDEMHRTLWVGYYCLAEPYWYCVHCKCIIGQYTRSDNSWLWSNYELIKISLMWYKSTFEVWTIKWLDIDKMTLIRLKHE